MKLVTYSRNQSISCGILADEGIIDIPSVWQGPNPPRSVKTILERGPACLAKLARHVDSVDINPEMTALAEKNLAAFNLPKVEVFGLALWPRPNVNH